ncbi:peptidoglycan-binding protein [Streptomyces monticola]|uniref:Peptidoglycan-binding protein n=1 Tax=Streptomyces monticola TaxID=2666263 RepID=A0ABW2JS99_9ACTN
MSARKCPQCGTPRSPDGGPACPCGLRAAEAVRDTRSAEAAAAEDFDPLRIRPYVSLPDSDEPDDGPVEEPDSGPVDKPDDDSEHGTGTGPADTDQPRVSSRPAVHTRHGRESTAAPRPTRDTAPQAPQSAPEQAAEQAAGPTAEPVPEGTPGPAAQPVPEPDPGPHQDRPGRRRTPALLTAAGAALAVVVVTVVATGLFSSDPDRERALPDHPSTAPASTAAATASRTPTHSASPRREPSPSRAAAAPPSSTRSAPPTKSASAPPPPTAAATGTVSTPSRSAAPPVLREGDKGPEVRELQERLRQLYLYGGPANGRYDFLVTDAVTRYQYASQVEGDERGVYGPATRKALESQTKEP